MCKYSIDQCVIDIMEQNRESGTRLTGTFETKDNIVIFRQSCNDYGEMFSIG